ncbi:MAG: hypothetical protein HY749_13385 [Gammaproteobacteria bacterium]|nr:hypothetical protein [Gammaproteobacteria bacterium]
MRFQRKSCALLSGLLGIMPISHGATLTFTTFGTGGTTTTTVTTTTNTTTTTSTAPTATQKLTDFQTRCAATGVLVCKGFDSTTDFTPAAGGGGYASGLYPTGSDRTYQGVRDTTTMASGAGSLKFNIRPGSTLPFSTNPAGYWMQQFGTDGAAKTFGENSTLYLQVRMRVDSNMLNYDWTKASNEGWKAFIVYGPVPGPSCTGDQFVQENSYQRNILSGYTSCGAPGLVTNNGLPPYTFQQGDYNCAYGTNYATDPGCFRYTPNTWITEYWVVRIGTYGVANSSFTVYAGNEGQPLKKVINVSNFKFGSAANHSVGMMAMILQPYFSGAIASTTTPAAAMWFDELIVSQQPIATPIANPPTTTTTSGGATSSSTSSTTTTKALPTGLGWHELPNTRIADVCPRSPAPPGSCSAVVSAWAGGVADTNRNRLLITGGGHNDYGGNEWYSLNLSNQTMTRLLDPSPVLAYGYESNPDGRPAARHNYGGLAYVPTRDRVFLHGGSFYGPGPGDQSVANWLMDVPTKTWTRLDPARGTPPALGCCAHQNFMAYDPNTDAIYMHDYSGATFRYDDGTNAWTKIAPVVYGSDVPGTAVVDEGRKYFWFIGGGRMFRANIATGGATTLQPVTPGAGCSALVTKGAPGLAYDPVTGKIVGWIGGGTVYEYDPATNTCATKTFAGGPGEATPNGMYGRFRYFPGLGVFAVVTDVTKNAFLLRLH